MEGVDSKPKGKDITIDVESWAEYKRIGKGGFNAGVLYVLDIMIYNEIFDVVVPNVPAPKGYRGIWAADGATDLRKKRLYLPIEYVTYSRKMGQGSLSLGIRSILVHYKRLSRKGTLKLRPKPSQDADQPERETM